MDENVKRKMERLDVLSRTDPKYKRMLKKCVEMEKQFERFTAKLSDEDEDLVWGFVMHCEDMSIRKLEIACEHMEFVPRVIAFRKKGE